MARTNAKHSGAFRRERMRLFVSYLRAAEGELLAALERVGIDAALIDAGEALYFAVKQAMMTQAQRQADLVVVRAELNAARTARVALFRKHRRRASEDIEDVRVRKLLHLDDRRVLRVAELHAAMMQFYSAALENPTTHAPLAGVGITSEVLRAGLADLERIERLDAREERLCIAKEAATKAVRQALDRMDAWRLARIEEATFATRHQPELMVYLGRKPRRASAP